MEKSGKKWIAALLIILAAMVLVSMCTKAARKREEKLAESRREASELARQYPNGDTDVTELTLDFSGVTDIVVTTTCFGPTYEYTFNKDTDESNFSWIAEMLTGGYTYAGMLLNDSVGGGIYISAQSDGDELFSVAFIPFKDKLYIDGYYYTKDDDGLDYDGMEELMRGYAVTENIVR
jgi:hypothetical protein